jgi:hypothetical protein
VLSFALYDDWMLAWDWHRYYYDVVQYSVTTVQKDSHFVPKLFRESGRQYLETPTIGFRQPQLLEGGNHKGVTVRQDTLNVRKSLPAEGERREFCFNAVL